MEDSERQETAETTPSQPKRCPRCIEREKSPDRRLPLQNSRHEKFCRNVALKNMKNADAYMQAGFETKNRNSASRLAGQLLKRLDIINRNLFLAEQAIEQDLKTREWVDDQLKEVAMRCIQKVPVLDRKGKPTGTWKFDSGGANTALQLMGKDRGMFVEKVQINQDDVGSDEDMEKMIETVFMDIGRHNCFRIMEKVFNVKIEFESKLLLSKSKTAETFTEPTVEPDSTVH